MNSPFKCHDLSLICGLWFVRLDLNQTVKLRPNTYVYSSLDHLVNLLIHKEFLHIQFDLNVALTFAFLTAASHRVHIKGRRFMGCFFLFFYPGLRQHLINKHTLLEAK